MKAAGLPRLLGRDVRAVHLVGAGGTGMTPLALYLRETGFAVTGEDDAWSAAVRGTLEDGGVSITDAGGMPADCDLLVYSSAIRSDHPARLAAAARSVPVVRRGALLAEVVRGRRLVAVVGAHGKTTTAAMLVTALHRAEFPCGWLLGGLFADASLPPGRTGPDDWVVAEIDESDGTIEAFTPEITVIVSLDWDHPDHYRSVGELEATFRTLVARTRRAVLHPASGALSTRVVEDAAAEAISFGPGARYQAVPDRMTETSCALRLGGDFPSLLAKVGAGGAFNAHNATAALAAAHLMGAELTPDLLAVYPGVRRRQSVLWAANRIVVMEDYAHHPAEIRALLASLRPYIDGRLIVVFQPHRFSRTAQFKAEFAAALGAADELFLLDVYPAGEAPVPGGTTADLLSELAKGNRTEGVVFLPGADGVHAARLRAALQPGDRMVFVGAGDIEHLAHTLVDRLAAEAPRAVLWDRFVDGLASRLSAGTRLVRTEPLAPRTTMRVGGAAQCYAEPAGEEDLGTLMREAGALRLPVFFLGRGSNLIVPDDGVDGLVICLAHPAWQVCEQRAGGRLWAGAGVRLKSLCGFAGRVGLQGFEFLEGIPGTVGGALRMNAGAMGGWIFDLVEEVRLMTSGGEVRTLQRQELRVAYRECTDLRDAVALGALFGPRAPADSGDIGRQIDVYRRKRHETQPREPSAGCIFKNPPGDSAGRLIDELGLKGERTGDAEVSRVHGNFIVNHGRATAADVILLMRRVRARVREARGVMLEPEVLLYGRNWEDVL